VSPRLYARIALTLLTLIGPGWALAADADPPPDEPLDVISLDDGADSQTPSTSTTVRRAYTLDEVVVTARREPERAIDVPITMTVVSGQSLKEAGITRPQEIQQRTPGMTVNVPSPRLTQYTIRGLGSTSQNDGMESSVGVFLDGVYLGRQGLSVFDLVDLDRVEVLHGPQGTLFGKNTTAGAINIVSLAPDFRYSSEFDFSLGDQRFRQVRGYLTGSLVDDELAGRLSFYMTRKEGAYTNLYDGSDLNEQHRQGLRGQLLWTPTESLSLRLIGEAGEQDEVCCVYPLIVYRDSVRARDEYMEYARAPLDFAERKTDSDTPTFSEVRHAAATAQLDWRLSDTHRIVSISAIRHWRAEPTSDDATSLQLVPETGIANDYDQLSQELRLHSDFGDLDSTVGLYYLHQRLVGDERNILGDDLVGWTFGGLLREKLLPFATESNTGLLLYALIPPATLDGMRVDTDSLQQGDSVAAFGSANWHISERVEATGGLRYTYEWKHGTVQRQRSGGCPQCTALSLVNPIADLLGTIFETPLSGLSTEALLDTLVGNNYTRDTRYKEGNWSGQVALSYHPIQAQHLYVSIARGYKGGGINLGATGESVEPTFKAERATAYEAGIKSLFYQGRLATALALYRTDVDNYQALTFDDEETLIPNPRQINLLNVGKVRIQGIEASTTYSDRRGLTLRAALAHNDAVTLDFPNAPDEDSGENNKDLSGEVLYNAPRWMISAGAEQSLSVDSDRDLYGGVDYYYRSGAWATVEHGAGSYVDDYNIVNLRVGLRHVGARWDISAFVNNVFDTDYLAAIYALYGVGDYGGTAGDQRSYGLAFKLYFEGT
jgi:iron complex outermembrane receptor protein